MWSAVQSTKQEKPRRYACSPGFFFLYIKLYTENLLIRVVDTWIFTE